MKFLNADGLFPLFIGDVQREIPGWVEGDPLPEGWRQVVETPTPSDFGQQTTQDTLNPDPVEGYIPEGCEGIREATSYINYGEGVEYNSETGKWVEVWQQEVVALSEPYPIVAVMVDGEWLTPEQYRALG